MLSFLPLAIGAGVGPRAVETVAALIRGAGDMSA
jgi:hypothetical protein